MKKRICSVLLVLCMLFSLLTITAAAEQSASFSVSATGNVEVGGTVSVSVSLSSVEDGRYFQCRLNYDTSLLKYVSHDAGSYSSNQTEGTVSVAYFNMAPESLGGTVLTVEFEAIAEGTASFSLSDCKVGAGDVADDISASGSGDSTVIEAPHVCAPEFVEEEPASCTATGVKAHYACECGKLYSDAEGKNEVTAASLVIPKKDHSYVDGECEHCGAEEPSGPVVVPGDPDEEEEEDKDPTFIDVLPGSYYYDAVEWAVANGITNGITANTFCPDMICTRAQMVTFLWRAAGKPQAETTEMPFTDVAEGAYYYDAVLWAVENGITNGTSATTFSPDAKVTRAQTVTFLWRMQEQPEADGEMIFTDVKQDAYYAEAVLWAVEKGITNGTSATTFSPEDGCTRAQIVTFLWRCLK